MGKLTVKKVEALTQPGFHGDGRNLWLKIDGKSKSWVFRYTYCGRQRMMGLGPFPDVSLADARSRASHHRAILKNPDNPRDPLEVRRELLAAREPSKPFREAAAAFIAKMKPGWSNSKHAAQWESTLSTYAHPVIGDMMADQIDTRDVLLVLEPIWNKKTETAKRVRQRVEKVLDYCTSSGWRTGENPARWRGHMENLLASPAKLAPVQHFAALPYDELPDFMDELRGHDGIAPAALEFLILTAARTGEVRFARWDEVNEERREWTIPAGRMKANKEHVIPLSRRALAILKRMKDYASLTDGYVFPGGKKGKPLSSGACLMLLRKTMSRDTITPHGFRSTFRDWAGEETAFPREVIEHALAHQLKDKAEAAYQRGSLLKKRRDLMDVWARYCAGETLKVRAVK